jgi:ribonuclease-3
MAELVDTIAAALGYRFRDPGLLIQALTHRSYHNECTGSDEPHNERLEFLGDAVVELAVSNQLMERLPDAREGVLTKLRAMVVSEASLARCASSLSIGEHLRLGRGEDQSGGRRKSSILADTLEALVGAVYLDGGYVEASDTVARLLGPFIEAAVEGDLDRDHKTRLQELAQRVHHQMPHYTVVEEEGPDHAKVFTVAVHIGEAEVARGVGASKKVAEQEAARRALDLLER